MSSAQSMFVMPAACASFGSAGASDAWGGWIRADGRAGFGILVDPNVLTRGVLFGCFAEKVDGDSWSTWWFNHLPAKSIYVP